MTWSIIARDPQAGLIGIAVATCAFAVGSLVPFVRTGVGAAASQAFVNPFYGPKALELMSAGMGPNDVVGELSCADPGHGQRQLHVMSAHGESAAFTGADCVPWCGHSIRDGFSIAGNMLAGGDVIEATARAFDETEGEPLALRFLQAMRAGEAAGGDKRGRQSAAMLIHDGEDYPLLNIRVDDHIDPLGELTRLEKVSRERFLHYRKCMPNRANPGGIIDRAEIERLITQSIAASAKA